jgi:hypothetical protein
MELLDGISVCTIEVGGLLKKRAASTELTFSRAAFLLYCIGLIRPRGPILHHWTILYALVRLRLLPG